MAHKGRSVGLRCSPGTAHRSRRRSRSTAPDEHVGQKNPAKDSMLFDLAQAPAAPQVAVEGTCNGLVRIA